MPGDVISRQWSTEPAVSAQDELSSCVWVGGMVPFLPAAGVTEMSGVRDSKGDKARRREGVTHELVTCSSAKCFAPIYTGLALWSRIAKYFEYLFSETM